MFYLGQLFGVIALVVLMISFQKNDKKTLLEYQILSSFFFAIQYLCLNAINGCLMNLIAMLRNVLFNKIDNKFSFLCLILILTLTSIFSFYSYTGLISLLPTIAVVLYSISLWQKNISITRIVGVVSCCLFIVYNIWVLAISGLVSNFLELISTMIAIYRFDLKMGINVCEKNRS